MRSGHRWDSLSTSMGDMYRCGYAAAKGVSRCLLLAILVQGTLVWPEGGVRF